MGLLPGNAVGWPVGCREGKAVGCCVGCDVGRMGVGCGVGGTVGRGVGFCADTMHHSRNATTTRNHVAGPDTTLRCPVASCHRFLLARGSDAAKSPVARLLNSSVITAILIRVSPWFGCLVVPCRPCDRAFFPKVRGVVVAAGGLARSRFFRGVPLRSPSPTSCRFEHLCACSGCCFLT